MASRLRQILWVTCSVVVPWASSAAQKGTGQVAGRVVDVTSGAVVASADIIHLGDERVVVSDSLGAFVFEKLPVGIVRLLVRGRGFPPLMVVVALARDESMSRLIELDSTVVGRTAAQALPAVAVNALRAPMPRFVDFERRRKNGRGQYVVREDIEKAGHASLQDAMRGLRGVNVDCGGGGFGCAIRMARAPMRCHPDYIVDDRLDNLFGPSVAVRDIEGIEVYTGPSDVPGEYAGRSAGCGVIVIWTRTGPSRRKG